MNNAYLVEALEDAVSDLERKIDRLEAQNEDLTEENEGLKEANEELEHMLNSEIYCRQARVQLGLGAGDRRT
jgi:chaperonin cofactor prefoldin